MTTVEDRLFADVAELSSAPDWDDVQQRSDARAARSRRVMRGVVGCLALLLLGAVVLQGGAHLDTIEEPSVTAPGPAESTPPWSETSPLTIVLRAALVWGSSAVIATALFFVSPRHFRAPYMIPRAARLAATAAWVALWNACVLAVTGVSMVAFESPFVEAMHGHAAFVEILSVTALALLLSIETRSTWSALWYFFAISATVPLVNVGMRWSGGVEESTPQSASHLGVHVLIAAMIAWLPWYVYRTLGWRRDAGRTPAAALRVGVRRPGGFLIVAGALIVGVAIAPALVFRAHISELGNELAGSAEPIRHSQHPFFAADAPTVWTHPDSIPEGGNASDVRLASVELSAELRQAQDLLQPLGFESFAFTIGDPEVGVLLWNSQARRPRGDSYGAVVVDVRGGITVLPLTAENTDAFVIQRTWRNVGLTTMITGAVFLWSQTSISRYMHGPRPWRPRPRWMEVAGWSIIGTTLAALVVAAAGRLFTPELDAVGRGFWRLLVPTGFGLWLGMWFLTPKPPAGGDG